jgi:hypothetical protein
MVRNSWSWPAAALLVAAASLAPLLVVDVPAVLDYPNHLARFYILAHPADPVLSTMYAPHWAVLPNIGMDLIGRALLQVAPVHIGGRLLLALSMLAPLAGVVLYARAAFERWTWWSLGVGVLAYNGIFFLGFMNFLLGLGVALAGAAAWRLLRRHRAPAALTAGAGALFGLCAFFCHVLGFGFFAILIGAEEADPLLTAWRERRLSWREAATTGALLAAAIGPSLALYVATHQPTAHGDPVVWLWPTKLLQAQVPFMIYDRRATMLSAAVVLAVVVLVWRRCARASGAALAWAALGGLFLVAPFSIGGGTFVDTRLPLMAALLLFAGLSPRLSPRAGMAVAAALSLLAVGRVAEVAAAWQGRAQDLAELRGSLAQVQAGAKILSARPAYDPAYAARNGRALPNVSLMDDHLAALGVIERRAFWPLLFADPGQQPVVVRPPYDRMSQTLGSSAPWEALFAARPSPLALAEYPYLQDWRARFDFVLLAGPPQARAPAGLTLVRAGEAISLYRITR